MTWLERKRHSSMQKCVSVLGLGRKGAEEFVVFGRGISYPVTGLDKTLAILIFRIPDVGVKLTTDEKDPAVLQYLAQH